VLKTLPSDGVTKLSPFQEFMYVLLKLRMNSSVEYLAYRFGIYSIQNVFEVVEADGFVTQ